MDSHIGVLDSDCFKCNVYFEYVDERDKNFLSTSKHRNR